MIYRCVACEQHYCSDCDGGQDSCEDCRRGPMCEDCAAEDRADHNEEAEECEAN